LCGINSTLWFIYSWIDTWITRNCILIFSLVLASNNVNQSNKIHISWIKIASHLYSHQIHFCSHFTLFTIKFKIAFFIYKKHKKYSFYDHHIFTLSFLFLIQKFKNILFTLISQEKTQKFNFTQRQSWFKINSNSFPSTKIPSSNQ
jgi:hypothetical protein